MAKNNSLDLAIRIGAIVDGSLKSSLSQVTKQVSGFAKELSNIGTAGLAAMGALATGTVAALAKCTDAAAEYENNMADVVKYVDGLADATGKVSDSVWSVSEGGNGQTYAQNYEVMWDALLDLSTQIPMTAEELAQLAAAAGQSGKSFSELIQYDDEGNISGFLKDVAMMGTAMDISAEQAGDWAAKWEQAFGMTHEDVMELADQINYLGANNATTAAEIAQVVNDSASLGQVAGMSPGETAAMATTMMSMGVDESQAATSISRIYTNMSLGGSATKAQQEMWQSLGFTAEGVAKSMQTDATGTLIDVFEAIGNLDADKQTAALKTLFGQWAIQGAAKLTENLDLFRYTLEMVNDPSLYDGSMAREFIIKASTPEAIHTMLSSAFQALQADIGEAFVPAQKEISLALIDFINKLRDMPELGQIAEQLATLFSQGVEWAGDALEQALPYIQQALDYLLDHGPEVVDVLGKLAATFATMKFAPQITSLVSGAGDLILGTQTGTGGTANRSGGLVGTVTSLFNSGRNAVSAVPSAVPAAVGRAASWVQDFAGATRENASTSGRTGVTGFLSTAASALTSNLSDTGVGRYVSGLGASLGGLGGSISSAAGNLGNTAIGGGIANAARGTVSVAGEILSNISGATGLTGLVNNVRTKAPGVGAAIVSKGSTLASNVVNSAPVQAVTGLAGRVASSAPVQAIATGAGNVAHFAGTALSGLGGVASSGLNVAGTALSPLLSGLGSIVSGAAPVVLAISGIIATLSLLWDNVDMLRGPIEAVFGEEGLKVFDTFKEKISGVFDSVQEIFDGGLAEKLKPMRETFENMLKGSSMTEGGGLLSTIFGGTEGGLAAFDGVVEILQSILGFIGQVVTFANTTVKPVIEEIFTFITGTVLPTVISIFSSAAPTISSIITSVGNIIMSVVSGIMGVVEALWPSIQNVVTVILNIASMVIPMLLGAIDTILPVIQSIIDVIIPVITVAISTAGGLIEGLATSIGEIIAGIVETFNGIIDFIAGVFTGNWERAWNGVKEIFGGIFSALTGLVKTPINAIIGIINGALSGIESLVGKLPQFVKDAASALGFDLSNFSLPRIPLLAKGGFTSGPSIAGEAGTEAVISFQNSERGRNIETWMQAGQMLGVLAPLTDAGNKPVELEDIPARGTGGEAEFVITFSPNITIKGNGDRETVDAALMESESRFEAWFDANFDRFCERRERRISRMAYT